MTPRPRRGHSFFVSCLAVAAFTGIGAATAACNIGLNSALDGSGSKGSSDPSFNESDAPSDAFASPPATGSGGTSGASDGSATFVTGSPLCRSSTTDAKCSPDDTAVYAASCAPADAGASSGDAGAPIADAAASPLLACRVHLVNDDRLAVCSAAGTGTDGAECIRSSDCHAGFECVKSPGRCRRYCCNNSCDDTQTFCDTQTTPSTNTDAPSLLVPVCAPVRACKLLGANCDADQTCAVVKQDGTTSCVQTGAAKAGDDCERAQCGADLTCLGQVGSRKCYRLCLVADGRACDKGQTCRGTAPLFKDATIGVCE